MRDKLGRFIKGHSSSKNTEFKKGFIPWNKGTKGVMKGFWKGKKFSKKHRENMSKAFTGRIGFWRGKKRPAEMYKRIVAKRRANKGYIFSPEARLKISLTHKGKILSEETKRKISISHKGNKNPMYGKNFSLEHRKKLSNKNCYRGKFGNKSFNWKGGIHKNDGGYVLIYKPKHHFCNISGYVFKHRLVMEKYLRRYLKPEEVVHHINGIVDDNRIKNLKLFTTSGKHTKFHFQRL